MIQDPIHNISKNKLKMRFNRF